jgi:general stress protein 26
MPAIIEKAAAIIKSRTGKDNYDAQTGMHCVMAQEDLDGRIAASVITASHSDGISKVYLVTGLNASKSLRAKRDPRASLCFSSDEYSISLKGRVDVSTDPELRRASWYAGLEPHFKGMDDPNMAVLIFTTETYTFMIGWEEVSGKVEIDQAVGV